MPGTLIANIGEMFEVATGGYFRATVHYVRSPRANADRVSLAHFFNPKLEAVLREVPLPSRLVELRPQGVLDLQNPIYAEFGKNALRGWFRSHPDVARRHYPEFALKGHTGLANRAGQDISAAVGAAEKSDIPASSCP